MTQIGIRGLFLCQMVFVCSLFNTNAWGLDFAGTKLSCLWQSGDATEWYDSKDNYPVERKEKAPNVRNMLVNLTRVSCNIAWSDSGWTSELPIVAADDSKIICGDEKVRENERLNNGTLILKSELRWLLTLNRYDSTGKYYHRNYTDTPKSMHDRVTNDYFQCSIAKKVF